MFYKPEGIAPAMLTAFNDDGSINEDVQTDIVDFCINSGCKMLFAVSSVGEFIHMETDQTCQLMQVVKKASRGRVPVLVGVTASHIEKSIDLAKHAEEIGCEALVCSPPFYYTVTQEIIERHYEMLAEAVPNMSIVMYNIPLFSTPLSYDLVKRVSTIPNVVAMKDSSGSLVDMLHFMDKVRIIGSDLNFLSGRDENIFTSTMLGGKGAMVGTATIFPEILVKIYNATLAGDYDTARNLQYAICLAIRTMFSVPFPLGFKAAMEVRGFRMGPPKAALTEADKIKAEGCRTRLHSILSELCEYAEIPLIRGRG
ncbi:MAG: dihydrodipicolinate synthase family protein [Candidatus Latescibacteria bacterium]|jgi:dihydrodipicolinate synthase/N-acetylneuraminate lyase|nr:dihydrodipicolinate synthase family protein [Candidatus Latescibacterota bacterium]